MGKIKVHELAKELGLQSRDVLAFLQEKGIEAKAAQSSVEDDAATLVRRKYGTGAAKPAGKPASVKTQAEPENTPDKKVTAAEAAPVKASAAGGTEKTESAGKASGDTVKPAPKTAGGPEEGRREEAPPRPKKKKTIIFVNNPGNSKMQGGRTGADRRNNGVVRSGIISGGKLVQPGEEKPRPAVRPATPARPAEAVKPQEPAEQKEPAARPVEAAAEAPAARPEPAPQTGAVKPEEPAVRAASQSQEPARTPGSGQRNDQGQPRSNEGRSQSRSYEGGAGQQSRSGGSQQGRPYGSGQGQQSRPYGSGQGQQSRPYGSGQGQGGRPYGSGQGQQSRPYGSGQGQQSRPYGSGTGQGGRPYGSGQGQQSRPYGSGQGQQNRSYGGGSGTGQGGRPYGSGTGQSRPYGGGTGQNRPGGGDRNGRPDYRTQNGQGRPGNQGGARPYQGGGSASGGNRYGAAGGRPQGSAGRPDSRYGNKGTGKETSVKDAEQRKRDEEKRRINQERGSKRTKKDLIYEEDGSGKIKNKAGRFIKPDVKPKDEREEAIKVITLPETLTIKELAEKMKLQPAAIIKKLFLQGKIVTVNQEISYEEAEEIAIDYDIMCEQEVKVDVIEELLKEEEEKEEDMAVRPPVICVMGHVDHGKTSLLDAIRKTNVTDREAGGITQHIGAYTVTVNERKITFLDTPGHEAFTAMRMRGANATDIAVLVVAADDGVMPQTVEAINHAKAAGIEIIVAVNKTDKPNANIDRVKQELAEYELVPEDWGGSTVFAPVSAKTGEGIPQLLEMILLTADILELKANPDRRARGLVIEAQLDKGRGPVATVLVQKGTLHVGDFISAGASHGKVRAMIDDKGRRAKEAGPSTPVEILGLSNVPNAGEVFLSHDDDKTARSYAETFVSQSKEKKLEETKAKMSLDDLFNQIREGDLKELDLIVKADVQGSVEALKQSLLKLSNEEVVVKCIHGGVGAINESDVTLASASNAIIIGFNVRPDAVAKATAEREGVDIRLYRVIYQAIEDIEAAMKGMLAPVFEEKVLGHAEVRQIFKASAVGNISGSYVLDGVIERGCKVRITREGKQIFEGGLASLKRFKDDVKEVKAGYECGLVFESFDQIQELDIVEAYKMVEVPR